jgi:hypothetical protein
VSYEDNGGTGAALFKDGKCQTWTSVKDNPTYMEPPKEAKDIVQIEVGSDFFMALRSDGVVISWGTKEMSKYLNSTLKIPSGLKDVVAISISCGCVNVLTNNGDVVSWGSSSCGGLDKKTASIKHPPGLKDICQIWQGIGLSRSGKVFAWAPVDDGGEVMFDPPSDLPKIKSLGKGVAITADGKVRGLKYYDGAEVIDRGMKSVKKKIKQAAVVGGENGVLVLFEDDTFQYVHCSTDPEANDLSNYLNPKLTKGIKNILDIGTCGNGDGFWVLAKKQ